LIGVVHRKDPEKEKLEEIKIRILSDKKSDFDNLNYG